MTTPTDTTSVDTTSTDDTNPRPGKDATVEELEADIKSTRDDLGETVEALSRKLDVKARAKDKVQDTKQRVSGQVAETRARGQQLVARAKDKATDENGKVPASVYAPAGAAVAVLLGVVGFIVWRQRG